MKLSQFLLVSMSIITFNTQSMVNSGHISKSKPKEMIEGTECPSKTFSQIQSRTHISFSRFKNQESGTLVFKGEAALLVLNTQSNTYTKEYLTPFSENQSSIMWQRLKDAYKAQ